MYRLSLKFSVKNVINVVQQLHCETILLLYVAVTYVLAPVDGSQAETFRS
jgi:hypothetical protein